MAYLNINEDLDDENEKCIQTIIDILNFLTEYYPPKVPFQPIINFRRKRKFQPGIGRLL